jgi:hypothetical protein
MCIPITLIFMLVLPSYPPFSCVFFFLLLFFDLLGSGTDPDPGDQLNADLCGSGSETLPKTFPCLGHVCCPTMQMIEEFRWC